MAHRLISLYRVTPKEKAGVRKQNGAGWVSEPIEYDVIIDILKDRMRGRENLSIGLYYDTPSRRFYTNPKEFNYQYEWDDQEYTTDIQYPSRGICKNNNEEEVFGTICS